MRIPSGHGGWEARSYMILVLGWWYLLLVCVHHPPRLILDYLTGRGKFRNKNFCNHITTI